MRSQNPIRRAAGECVETPTPRISSALAPSEAMPRLVPSQSGGGREPRQLPLPAGSGRDVRRSFAGSHHRRRVGREMRAGPRRFDCSTTDRDSRPRHARYNEQSPTEIARSSAGRKKEPERKNVFTKRNAWHSIGSTAHHPPRHPAARRWPAACPPRRRSARPMRGSESEARLSCAGRHCRASLAPGPQGTSRRMGEP